MEGRAARGERGAERVLGRGLKNGGGGRRRGERVT